MPQKRHLVLLGLLIALGASAWAQDSWDPTKNPYLRLTSPSNWDFRREMNVFVTNDATRQRSGQTHQQTDRLELSHVTVVAPLNAGCATARVETEHLAQAALLVDQTTIVEKPTLAPGYPNGEQLARWDANNIDTRQLTIAMRGPATTYETKVDENAAMRVQWPSKGYSESIASSLAPQRFIECDDKRVVALMNRWTSNNPHGPNPYLVAKALAGRVQESFQPSGSGSRTDYPARFAGVELEGAAAMATRMRGTDPDMAALLCAVYRAAGLPARVVIGLDVAGSPGGRSTVPAASAVCRANFDPDNARQALLRTWVEFYLYDEANDAGGWIPVDIVMLRRSSNRMQDLMRPWDGFGGGMCYDHLIPITYSFVPPIVTDDDSKPALWAWITTPAEPSVETGLVIEASRGVVRGGRR
ncbi:MAG: transglutaminase domain-containing protein [Phycisphaeraceae bacterium]|nr:transglutaminase domain-containing protein [Phycisphaeraceae bacterium]